MQKLTESEFSQAVRNLKRKIKEQNLLIAKAVLVDGKTQYELAKTYDTSPQNINHICNRIIKALPETKTPDGWEKVEAILPGELANTVRQLEKYALSNLPVTQKSKKAKE